MSSLIIGDSQCKYLDEYDHLCKERIIVTSTSGLKIEDVDDDMLEACAYFDHVFLHVGTNNMVGKSPASASSQYETLVSSLRQKIPTVKIFISGVIPRATSYFKDLKKKKEEEIRHINEKAQEFNFSLKQLCSKYENCYYVDNWSKFTSRTSDVVRRKLLSRDGLHLSVAGTKTLMHSITEATGTMHSNCVSDSSATLLPVTNSIVSSMTNSLHTNYLPSSGRFKTSVTTSFKTVLPQYAPTSKPKVTTPSALVLDSIDTSCTQTFPFPSYADALINGKVSEQCLPPLIPPVTTKTSTHLASASQDPMASNPVSLEKNQFPKLKLLPNSSYPSSQPFPMRVSKRRSPTLSNFHQESNTRNKSKTGIPKKLLQKKPVTKSTLRSPVTAKSSAQLASASQNKNPIPPKTISLKKSQFSKLHLLSGTLPSFQPFPRKTKPVTGKSRIIGTSDDSFRVVPEKNKMYSKKLSRDIHQYDRKSHNCNPRKSFKGLLPENFCSLGGGEQTDEELAVDDPSSGEEYFKPKKRRDDPGNGKCSKAQNVTADGREQGKKGYKCETCCKIYSHKSTHSAHIKFCNKKTEEVLCRKCKVCYKNAVTYRKHLKNCNPRSTRYTQCVFPKCHKKFYTRSQMVDHLDREHEQETGVQHFMFENFEQLNEWKNQEDKGKFMSTVRRAGKTTRGDVTYHYYACNFDVKKRPHRGPGRLFNFKCTARILVREENDKLRVKYISAHSHALEVKNLQYHQHSKETLGKIKAKFGDGVPPIKVLEQMRPPDDGVERFPEKEHLIPLKTITDMLYRHNRSLRLHKEDAMSVSMWVDMLSAKGEILIYKPQNEKTVIGPKEIDDLEDSSSLFILGYQNDRMRQEMLAGSSKVLCVDATHGTNMYGFSLLNLIVPDEYGVGYPVAHFITSSLKEGPVQFMFESIKEKLPDLKVNVLMTDDDSVTWPAFHDTFGGDTVHYLCLWHVDRAWKNQLRNHISNAELRQEIYNYLCTMIDEQDTNLFDFMLESFIRKYSDLQNASDSEDELIEEAVKDAESSDLENASNSEDEVNEGNVKNAEGSDQKHSGNTKKKWTERDAKDAKSFIDYFTTYYANRAEKWAKCHRHRPYADTDTNMYCEAFHSTLKSGLYLNRKVNGRIDNLLDTLKRFEYRKSVDLKRKRLYEKAPLGLKKGVEIQCRHTRGLQISDAKVKQIAEKEWHVTSCQDEEDYYEVHLYHEYCPLADHCDQKCYKRSCLFLCMHMYVCECPDRHPLCKHKHKVHSLRVRNDPILSDIKVERQDPAEWKLHLEPAPKHPPLVVSKPEKMLNDLNYLTDKLRSCFTSQVVQEKLFPRLKGVLQQLICECEFAIKRGKKDSDPPPMRRTKIPPNKKAEKQKVIYRTTRKRAKPPKKLTKPTASVKISFKNKLMHMDTDKSTDELLNHYAHDSNDLRETLFYMNGYDISLRDLKSLDDRIKPDEVAALKTLTITHTQPNGRFEFGWLTDSIIDAFTSLLKKAHPHILHLNTFVGQILNRRNEKQTTKEIDESIKLSLNYLKFGEHTASIMIANPTNLHWVLLVTDLQKKSFLYLNPLRPKDDFRQPKPSENPLTLNSNGVEAKVIFKQDRYQYFFDKWRMVLESKTGIKPGEWQLLIPEHVTQKDGYNCGVFVCWFYERLLTGQLITTAFSTHDYRMHMLRELMREGKLQLRRTEDDGNAKKS